MSTISKGGYSPGVWATVGVEVRGDWVTLCQSDSVDEGPQRESNSEPERESASRTDCASCSELASKTTFCLGATGVGFL